MKLLSFDVGIKNLAFCQLDTSNKSILDWGIINISIDPTCDHVQKGKCCDKSATKIIKSSGMKLCTGHTKLKSYKDIKMNNIKKIDNSMFHLGKNIVKLLDEKSHFLESEVVIIENQPALKNPTMKSIQMILYSYFLMKDSVKDIQMINARNKLKVYKGEPVECKFKEKYKRNKYLSVEYTKLMILEEDQKFIDLFSESKKKDDLADAYLQGIYFIEK